MNSSPRGQRRRPLTVLTVLMAVSIAVLCLAQLTPAQVAPGEKTKAIVKRPLTHNDYDSWRSIQSPMISPDGRFVAYTLVSPDGSSELVVRDMNKGGEVRHSRGKTPVPTGETKALPGQELVSVTGKAAFTPDAKRFIFSIATAKANAVKKADKVGEKDKSGPSSLGVLDLSDGKVTVLTDIGSFLVSEEGASKLVYHKMPPPLPAPTTENKGKNPPPAEKKADWLEEAADQQQPKGQPMKDSEGKTPAVPTRPSELVVMSFDDGSQFSVADVTSFGLSRDGRVLACAVAGKEAAENGVFAIMPGGTGGNLLKVPLATARGKYSRFTWDEKQKQIAFFGDHTTEAKDSASLSLYWWDGVLKGNKSAETGQYAVELLNSRTMQGLKEGCTLTDRGGLKFTDDGEQIILGVAGPQTAALAALLEEKAGKGKDTKPVVELWHWKDDFIQPMQKARLTQEQQRTFPAIFHISRSRFVQLGDPTVQQVTLTANGKYGLGFDDHPYRAMLAYDGTYADVYMVNGSSGTRKLLLKKQRGAVTFSPGGSYAIYFDGKDWNTISIPNGTVANITKNIKRSFSEPTVDAAGKVTGKADKSLPVKFFNEDFDNPSTPPAHGILGWTPDENSVLLYDKFDIWEVSPRGTSQRMLTSNAGWRSQAQLRYVKLDPKEKAINLSAPMLLRFDNILTRETGFIALDARASGDGLVQLKFGDLIFGTPIKAKNAPAVILTGQTFYNFPDLFWASGDFKTFTRVSNANPQKDEFNWGTSELIHYKSADGEPLTGVLVKPENFDPSKQYPLLVYIYERLSQNLHQFATPKGGPTINPSYYASNGYLVFMPDIHYTIGYPGQSAFKCVLPGVQAVIDRRVHDKDGRLLSARSAVNENAIGIQGHSWGGYQVSYLITQTHRFKAAAAGAAVSNMTSAYDGVRWGSGQPRQFQYEKTQSRIGGSLWEFPTRFLENSPVFMADRVKTPLLMLHNEQDDVVPWQQGIEYYLALRRLDKEVYLFNYPGEKHGLQKRENQKDYAIRMEQFFDHHLRGAPAPEWMLKGMPYSPRAAIKDGSAGGGSD